MVRLIKALCTLSVLSLVVACGESPLTDAQKAEIKALTKSANSVASTTQSRGAATPALAAGDETPEARLSAKLSSCDFKTPDASSEGADMLSMSMTVGGTNCPISMDFSAKATMASETSGSVAIKLFYQITDTELADLIDVSKMDIAGTISGAGNSGGGKLEGTIQSKKFGNIGVTMDITGNSGGVSNEVTYQMNGYKAKFGFHQNGKEISYTVQGQKVSLAQLKDYLDGGSLIPGMSPQTAEATEGGGDEGGNNSFTYNYEYNGCSTGTQTFSSQAALCEGLKDDSLNKGCAASMRRDRFAADKCSGSF